MTARTVQRSGAYLALSCIGAFSTAPAWGEEVKDAPAVADRTPVAANDDPDQRRVDDVVVNGERLRDADPKAVAPLVNTSRSIVVLPREVIEQTGSNSLEDALRTVPGITFGAAEGGNPIGDRPFIRGFDSQGSVYVDGVRDFAAQTREVFATDTVQIVRGSDSTLGGRGSAGGTINIVSRLPQLDNFGSVRGSYGNADYKRVTADLNLKVADTVAFRIEGLWHDQDVAGRDALYSRRWGVAPSFTIGLGTPTRLTGSYYYLESHALPDSGIPYLYTLANAPGTGNIVSRPAIGTVRVANGTTGHVDRSTFYGLANRDFRDTTTHQAMLRAEHDFGGVTLRNTARYTHNYQAYIYTQPDDSQGNVYGTTTTNNGANLTSGGYVWRRSNTRYGYAESIVDQTDLFGTFRTGGIEHSFSLGSELSWEQARRGTFVLANGSGSTPRCTSASVARYNCTSLFSPNPYDPWVNYTSDTTTVASAIAKSGVATETQQDSATRAVYAFDSITLLPSLILNLGARYDHFRSVVTPPSTTGTFRLSRSDGMFNWQAGLVLKPTANTSLYGSYATSSTPPNSLLGEGSETNSVGTTNTATALALLDSLKVTRTKSYEVGAKAQLFDDRLLLTLAGFDTRTANARVTDENGNVGFVGKTRIRGIEFGANGTILPGWTVFGGYTYLDPVIVDGGFTALAVTGGATGQTVKVVSVNTGKQVPQTAKNSFTATTNVELFHRFAIGGTAIYMDRQYGGYQDNRSAALVGGVVTVTPATKVLYREIPGYWRFDARASFKVTPNVELSVNAQNLTDKTYFTQAYASHYASIAAGRTVFGTVGVTF